MAKFLVVLCAFCMFSTLSAQHSDSFAVVFYNVENLFDTINDPGVRDGEYTPTGSKEWNSSRYYSKLSNLSRVIYAAGPERVAAYVFCEVENRGVLEDLIRIGKLDELGFEIETRPSPDRRGIQIAALVNTNLFQTDSISLIEVDTNRIRTRDMLVLHGTILGEVVSLIGVHWPSKYGGELKSNWKRQLAAETLLTYLKQIPHCTIIGGDFNDNLNGLALDTIRNSPLKLVNLYEECGLKSFKGTHNYRGRWNHIDQAWRYKSCDSQNWQISSFEVIELPWMLLKNGSMHRTFRGPVFLNGYSDHLPIRVWMKY